MEIMRTNLNMADICRRTAVERPYFAFNELFLDFTGTVIGEVQREHPLGHEYGPLGSAEIGRHLAILGSCAAAAVTDNDDRLYYLATHAELSRSRLVQDNFPTDEKYRAFATVVDRTARTLLVRTAMQAGENTPFVSLLVKYKILSEPLFARLFSNFAVAEDCAGDESPYTKPISLSWSAPNDNSIIARSFGLTPRECAGHFRGYPAWPVSIIASCMLRSVERLLHHVLQSPVQWITNSCNLDAYELIPAAASVVFSITYNGIVDRQQHRFTCEAYVGEKLCARLVTVTSTLVNVAWDLKQ
ncbi:hypothetical protein [Burkholderia pyrrocinia]